MSKNHLLLPTSASTTHHTMLAKEYLHFSPGALFIWSAYVLHIYKHLFHPTQMDSWENCNANFLSHFLQLSDYFNESADCYMDHFSPIFPYISHLPCKKLYHVWNLSAQVSERVPLDNIFQQINMCIYGKAITSHTSNSLLSLHYENNHEQISSLRRILMEACSKINREMSLARNCEKQKCHQNKKKVSLKIQTPKDQDKT